MPGKVDSKKFILLAKDGYPLHATQYESIGQKRANLIVAGATGVSQRFYRRFAEYAATRGLSTLTLDYRGIGLSSPKSLKTFRMDYCDWARLDLAAAVQVKSLEKLPLLMVGHSFGGQAFGMLPNHDKVSALYTFATGAGWHGWMPPLERAKVKLMWGVLGPAVVAWKGYLAWSLFGMGEDLPIDVYQQWKKWCSYPDYFFGDPDMHLVAKLYDKVNCPIRAANSIDDLWALPRSRDAFMKAYHRAAWEAIDLDPKDLGLNSIGHMGYFGKNAQVLWDGAIDWFESKLENLQLH